MIEGPFRSHTTRGFLFQERIQPMVPRIRLAWAALTAVVLVAGSAQAADLTSSLKKGTPDLKSAGPLAFGPDGILFVGDTQGAANFEIDTGDKAPGASGAELKVEGIDTK